MKFIDIIIKILFKEFKIMLQDGGVIMLFFIAIIIYPILYSLTYSNELVKEIPVAVVDQSQTPLSRKLIQMVDATDEIQLTQRVPDFYTAEELLKTGKVSGIFLIPDNFESCILRSETASVSIYADASYMLIYKQIASAINYSVGTLGAGIEIKRRMAHGQSMQQATIERDPLSIKSFPLYNPYGSYASYAMPAIILLILQQTLLLGIGLLGGTDNEKGVASYLTKYSSIKGGSLAIVLGKSFAYFIIYVLNTLFVLLIIFRIFRYPMLASYSEVFLFLIPFLLSIIFMGLTIASLFKSRESSIMVLLFTSIPFIFMSGFSWPIHAMPQWINTIAQAIPSTPAIKGFLALSQKGVDFSHVFVHWQHLWLLTISYLITSALVMRQKKTFRLK